MTTLASRFRTRPVTTLLIVIPLVGSVLAACFLYSEQVFSAQRGTGDVGTKHNQNAASAKSVYSKIHKNYKDVPESERAKTKMVPRELVELGVYNEATDFVNEKGLVPTGWEYSSNDPTTWGPCRFTSTSSKPLEDMVRNLQWANKVRRKPNKQNKTTPMMTPSQSDDYYHNADVKDFDYQWRPPNQRYQNQRSNTHLTGWCRPGFLVIGQGKCGTSSLYHYLMGHPRIVPAAEKQIHYFKYYLRKPLEWYYGHFPSPKSFLEHGALMTGEASPGYLPYPGVARDVFATYSGQQKENGAGVASNGQPLQDFLKTPSLKSQTPSVPPRIIAIGREPLSRMYSSYKYNYVYPTIEYLRTKGHPQLPSTPQKDAKTSYVEKGNPNDDYYKPYLFTLEEFVRAELKQLKQCLYDWGPSKTHAKWSKDAFYQSFVERRNGANATTAETPPLIDLDGICYGDTVSSTVYREQWNEMQTENPTKVLLNKSLYLTQALLGRSLYAFPLEWWYLNYYERKASGQPPIFVCTEEMSNPDTLDELTVQLGLPKFDGFETIVGEGAYNVGGHRGYDTATSWEALQADRPQLANTFINATTAPEETETNTTGDDDDSLSATNGIPLPIDLYREVKEFVDPLNERLFALTGKRCNW